MTEAQKKPHTNAKNIALIISSTDGKVNNDKTEQLLGSFAESFIQFINK